MTQTILSPAVVAAIMILSGSTLTIAGTLTRLYGNGSIHPNECTAAQCSGLFLVGSAILFYQYAH